MASSFAFAAFLVIFSGALVWMQLQAAQRLQTEKLEDDERRYLERRHRRRLWVSSLIAVVAGLILGGLAVRGPLSVALYWFGVLLVTLCILALAVGDMLSTRTHYSKARNRQAAERAALQAEIERFKRRHDNSSPDS